MCLNIWPLLLVPQVGKDVEGDRWEQIAALVPGKTKAQCFRCGSALPPPSKPHPPACKLLRRVCWVLRSTQVQPGAGNRARACALWHKPGPMGLMWALVFTQGMPALRFRRFKELKETFKAKKGGGGAE
jgi:hypothetical protein